MTQVKTIDFDSIFERSAGHRPDKPLTYPTPPRGGYLIKHSPTKENEEDHDAESTDTY